MTGSTFSSMAGNPAIFQTSCSSYLGIRSYRCYAKSVSHMTSNQPDELKTIFSEAVDDAFHEMRKAKASA